MKLIIIRPEPGASRTASRARNLGLDPVIIPLFEIIPKPWKAPEADAYDALLVSSANAIRHGGAGLKSLLSLPVYAVGKSTASAALDAGFKMVATGQSGAQSILDHALDRGCRRILWLTGVDHVRIEPEPDKRIVYQSCILDMPDHMIDILREESVVALHSQRAALHFANLVDKYHLERDQISIVVLSGEVAGAATSGWRKVAVASTPDDMSLLAAALTCFTNGGDVS